MPKKTGPWRASRPRWATPRPSPSSHAAAEATLPLTWRLSNAPAPSQLPPPPFSSTRLRWDTLSPTPLGAMQADSLIVLGVPDGTTLLELENSALALRIHGRPPAFPNVMEPMELMAPLRYIASR